MVEEVAKLKAELEALNLQCQLARDNEIRYALQRTRLETGRMQLMLKIVDAIAPSTRSAVEVPSPQPVPTPRLPEAGNGDGTEKPIKPEGLPTCAEMVLAVLKDAGPGGLRPPQVTRVARKRWWPDMPTERAAQTMYAMAKAGRLRKHGVRYRLPDPGADAGSANGLQSAAPETAETQAGAGSSAAETLAAMRSRKAAAMRRWRARNPERQVAGGPNGRAG